MRRSLAEFLATFILVFTGTGAIVVDQATGGAIGHTGVSLVFGLVVLAMIHTFGEVSGAHLNPAVTLAFATARRFPWRDVPAYLAAQSGGALAASLLLHALFPSSATLGATLPTGSASQSFILEVVLTAILMLAVLRVSDGGREKGLTAGLTIGAIVGLEALFAGPISGASMNPVRSLAPALVSGHLEHLWLYPAATLLGALLAIPLAAALRSPP